MTKHEILNDENKDLEFKEEIPSSSLKYLKTIVAFANCEGGKLVFGIEDSSLKIKGFKGDIHQAIDAITNTIADSIFPLLIPNIYKDTIDGKQIIVVEVFHGSSTPYFIKALGEEKGTFVRTAGSSRTADPNILKELTLLGLNRSYDELPYAEMKPVSVNEIKRLASCLSKYAKENASVQDDSLKVKSLTLSKMLAMKLVLEQKGKYYPSNAFKMLEKTNPFPFLKIQCARFKGLTRNIFIDKKEYEGEIYFQVDEAMKFIENHINLSLTVEGLFNHQKYELPTEAIREILVNGQCHRLFTDPSCLQVAVYDDRVEITSPGTLYNGLTLAEMKQGKPSIRNRCIVEVFKYLGIIENWGSGIIRAYSLCKEANVKEPEITNIGTSIRVNFYRPTYKSPNLPIEGLNLPISDSDLPIERKNMPVKCEEKRIEDVISKIETSVFSNSIKEKLAKIAKELFGNSFGRKEISIMVNSSDRAAYNYIKYLDELGLIEDAAGKGKHSFRKNF